MQGYEAALGGHVRYQRRSTFQILASGGGGYPVTMNRDEIFKLMSQPVCWTGSAKAAHLLPVNARL